ncbi:wall-associated receptor kinase 1-like [Triticum dicoccoides]|uniref:wall-associated receptor kinase 1-like n=1 Tax=Triticum dicoccoides TaxID=85692 RepID=UPI0018912C47|nr:wall-associated receptor kinase 1-like [Triticum dicoccoides]
MESMEWYLLGLSGRNLRLDFSPLLKLLLHKFSHTSLAEQGVERITQFNTMLVLLILAMLGMAEARASAVVRSFDGSTTQPLNRLIRRLDAGMGSSNLTLSCANRCGHLTFSYPFGIGAGCFRNPEFSLICNHTTNPPKLFLHDGSSTSTTQVVGDIYPSGMSVNFWGKHLQFSSFFVNFSKTIPMKSGLDAYNMSWTPGKTFSLLSTMSLSVIACDLDVYLVHKDLGNRELICKVSCPSIEIAEQVYRQDRHGPGSCSFTYSALTVRTLEFQFVPHKTGASVVMKATHISPVAAQLSMKLMNRTCMSILWNQPLCSGLSLILHAKRRKKTPLDMRALVSIASAWVSSAPWKVMLDTDIDECKRTPGLCKGNCQNTIGNYTCTKCPDHTEYDITKMQCTPVRKQNFYLGIVIGLSSGLGMLLFGLTTIFLVQRWKRDVQKKLRRKYFRRNNGLLLEQLISGDENASERKKIFSFQELKRATNNFDPARILGRGGHGTVYKGILSNQHVVAIKKSQIIREGEISDFINEVAILSQINHRNIVKLSGCCLETEVPLLVYDFIPNGSLFESLHHDSSNMVSLTWNDCLRIASEAAGALCYLHSAASISIFHRDVKSSNILLDTNSAAKVSDFGASRIVPIDQTHVATNVQGTFGYFDPEYYQTGQLNEKSDVYSFGVVLLELLIRKKPVFTAESGMDESLCNYFLLEIRSRQPKEIVAAQVLEEASEEEINGVASLAEKCLRLKGEERPTMKEVETTLQQLRMNRTNSSQVYPAVEYEMQGHQSMAMNLAGRTYNVTSQRSQNACYSLEQEFLASASLPR